MRHILLSLLLGTAPLAALPELRVAPDHRHLETTEGKPFFLLGDTAWELFHRLTREETITYLDARQKQGFNTVLAVALAEFEFDQPNAYGELPLENNDPAKPRDAYFQHIDWVIGEAAKRGLYTGLLPTWGDKWNKKWGKGPEIFTPENAARFGEWLGRRYKDQPVIWILGGDRPIENESHRAIQRAMAGGIKKGDGGKHLISYHPMGEANSSDYWPDEAWLDFHMFQSGHGRAAFPNYTLNARNLALPALKPTLDGEPNYEDHPVRGLMKDGKPTLWFGDHDVRRSAWWSVLSGACGHVYGTHSIWQFHDPAKRKQLTDARTPWQQALSLPGAAQMGIMRRFMEGLDWTKLRRDDTFLKAPEGGWKPDQMPMAAVAEDGSFAVVYLPDVKAGPINHDPFKVSFKPEQVEVIVFDPETGEQASLPAGTPGAVATALEGKQQDRVLLIREKAGR
ncbi:DUF4038 domain-containing protein [Luteolibacter sp. Populi]|uniref:apiosidase-like domain-containing protein n=1 Tax=Luteolibacter sp. Populi TaxID=3230487 RepID=UPI00346557C3